MSDLQQSLEVLLGQKIRDEVTGLWHVYDTNGVEISDPSGILLRGNPGALLTWPKSLAEEEQSHSGDARLWMYQLYEEAIRKDEEKRKQQSKQVKQQPQQRPIKEAQEPLELTVAPKPLPVFTPVFTQPEETAILDNIINTVISQPLPRLTVVTKTKPLKEKTRPNSSVSLSEDDDEETLFLLMVA